MRPFSTTQFDTLVELLRCRARHQPNQRAYIFLQEEETEGDLLTYGELDRQVRAIAARLQTLRIAGERALLLYPPGLEFIAAFFGCLYAGVIAVPVALPRPKQALTQIQAIAADARATIVLTTTSMLSRTKQQFAHTDDLAALHWLVTDAIDGHLAEVWKRPEPSRNTLAYLQYTSGSTSMPKGVMVSHGNVLHNLGYIHRKFGYTPDSVSVTWLPHFHDMGLVNGLLQPVYHGIPGVLMSPLSFVQRPLRWLQAISRYRGSHSGGPNFAYELCVHKITPEQRATVDLSSWRVAYNGAEPVRKETLERFAEAFAPCGLQPRTLRPAYGLAEATLMVSGGRKSAEAVFCTVQAAALEQHRVVKLPAPQQGSRTLVGCGCGLDDVRIVIVDPETSIRCAPDAVGEIWVASPSVALGYWERPQETGETFRAFLANTGDGPFLRTGDLGFVQDDELFITGRLKDVIIIRGNNYYPQDIEATVETSHPAVRAGGSVAFSVAADDGEQLVVVQELERRALKANVNDVCRAIRQTVAEHHELHVHTVVLVKPGSIPKTTSGKMQRHACRTAFLSGQLAIVGSNTLESTDFRGDEKQCTRDRLLALGIRERQQQLQAYLREQMARVLKRDLSQLSMQQPLSTLGLDSLMAMEFMARIETSLAVRLPVETLLQGPTIDELVTHTLDQLTRPESDQESELKPVHRTVVDHPLSHGQQALWFLHQLNPESTAYTVKFAVRVHSQVDLEALQRTLQALIERHPALRTVYVARYGRPVQQVQDNLPVHFEVIDASAWPPDVLDRRLIEEAHRPFDLEHGPILRVALFTQSAREHILLFAVHHIAVDLWSLVVLLDELRVLYPAARVNAEAPLPALSLTYTDWVHAQHERLVGSVGQQLWTYWQNQLADAPQVLNLPTDYPRPPIQTYRGACHSFRLDEALTLRIKELAKAEGATLYMMLLAAFQVLLYRYTGQEDLMVGSPAAGRLHAGLEGLVGYFVNPIVLRARLTDNPSFRVFLDQVRQTVLGALAHQDFPFPLLVERLQPERDPSRSPLFQTMFVLEKPHRLEEEGVAAFVLGETAAYLELEGLWLESMVLDQRTSQFDLTLQMVETGGGLAASFEYNSDLFHADTMARMLGHFQTLLAGIVAEPERSIATLPLLTAAERQQMLVEWNDTTAAYPEDQCLHHLIESQAERTPEAVAVIWEDTSLTYGEMTQRANQLAHYLRAQGVGPERMVGLYMERSLELVVGLLGILKAGGAYVPLDPTYPASRLQLMLEETQPSVVLTQARLASSLPASGSRVVCLDTEWPRIAQERRDTPASGVTPEHLAYVLYTSGSSGRPNGVMVPHRGVVNYLHWCTHAYEVEAGQGAPVHSSLSFDLTITSLFAPLCVGRSIHLVPQEQASQALGTALRTGRNFSLVKLTPAHLEALRSMLPAEAVAGRTRALIIGGEVLRGESLAWWATHAPATRLINEYGPTETVVGCCVYEVPRGTWQAGAVPIGRPIANVELFILDASLQPTPIGVPGELYIGGVGVARGYLRRPELSAERFIAHPFRSEPGARLYKSGDLARYRPDGIVEFLGRRDEQVKVRGYRVELGEIEAVMQQHEAVHEAVVLAQEERPGDTRLVAYVVPATSLASAEGENGAPLRALRDFLQQQLPDYMIPATFVWLQSLPLTTNGKVDRQALPEPDSIRLNQEKIFAAPRDRLESQLVTLWEEVLGIRPIGVSDNFFELGGHSLLGLTLFSRIEKAFGKRLSVEVLFQSPTVAQLADLLRQAGEATPWKSLVPLQPHGTKSPLFWVYAGNVLLPYIDPDQPLYGLEHLGQDGYRITHTRVEDIAAYYLEDVLTVQSQGPYFLGGYSFGGLVAFEMAQQLQKQGKEVALLILLDPAQPGDWLTLTSVNSRTRDDVPNIIRFRTDVSRHMTNLRFLGFRDRLTYVSFRVKGMMIGKFRNKVKRPMRWIKRVTCRMYLGIGRPIPPRLRSWYINKVYSQARQDYVPEAYQGRVVLFRTAERPSDFQFDWSRLVAGLEIHEIPGDHTDLWRDPYVRSWAEQVVAYLDHPPVSNGHPKRTTTQRSGIGWSVNTTAQLSSYEDDVW